MNNMQKSFKQKAQLGMRAANPIQKMQLGATPHMGSGKPPRMASGLAQRFADGGRVHGMGGPTQDKVSAKLSPGEYVLPADTVAAVGAHNLDGLRAATHVPVAPNAPNHFANGGQPDPNTPVVNHDNPLLSRGADGFLHSAATPAPTPTPTPAPAPAPAPTPPNPTDNPRLFGRPAAPVPVVATATPVPVTSTPAAPAVAPPVAPAESFLTGLRNAPGRIINGMQADIARSNALKNGTASPSQLKQNAEDKALFNDPSINNPWADIPFLGAGAKLISSAEAAAPLAAPLAARALNGLKGGISKATDMFGRRAAATAEVAPATASIAATDTPVVIRGVQSAERLAADAARNQQEARFAALNNTATKGLVAAKNTGTGTAALLTRAGLVSGANSIEATPASTNNVMPAPAKTALAAAATTPAADPALAAQQVATTQANAALPAGLKDTQGNLNGDAIFAAQPHAIASAPIAAAQAQQVQSAMQQGLRTGSSPVSGDGTPIATMERYADPAAAEAYYRNRTESQLSPQGIAESNAFIRANAKTANSGTVVRDNAAFASRGLNVTKSVDSHGNVTYSNTSANPYMNSKFADGRTGNDIAADNKAQENIGLQEAQIRQQAHADDAVLAQRQQLMDAVKNAPTVARQNAAISALSVFNQNNAGDKDRAERAQERAASLRAAQYQYQIAHEDRMQVREMEAHKQGFTEHEAKQKQNEDMIRALSMDPSTGKLNPEKYAQNSAFATSTLASLKDANGRPTPKDLGSADAELMKNIRLGMEARDAKPYGDSVLKPLGLGASQPMNLAQSMPTDKRPGIGGPEYLINGSWIPANRITGASMFGYGGDKEQEARLDEQVAAYQKQLAARR